MSWLRYVNLSDEYERRARFLPALFALLPLVPIGVMLGDAFAAWWKVLLGGVGLGAVISVGLSHLASAFGNRLQGQLWPRWPHDAPTNEALNPRYASVSTQRREQYYDAVNAVVGIDLRKAIASGSEAEVEAAINDSVSVVRGRLDQSSHGTRLRRFNIDYGYARNLTGMRAVWLGLATLGAAAGWTIFALRPEEELPWPIVSSAVALASWPIAFVVLPGYVRAKARYYTEAFYLALMSLAESKKKASRGKG